MLTTVKSAKSLLGMKGSTAVLYLDEVALLDLHKSCDALDLVEDLGDNAERGIVNSLSAIFVETKLGLSKDDDVESAQVATAVVSVF